MFDYEVSGCTPTAFESEARQIIADLMLVSAPIDPAAPAVVSPPWVCQTTNCSRRGIPSRLRVCPACAVNTKELSRNPVTDLISAVVSPVPALIAELEQYLASDGLDLAFPMSNHLLRRAITALAHLPSGGPAPELRAWQPIETAPKDGTRVLVAMIQDERVWRVSDASFRQIGWYTGGGESCHWRTHWMPMPDPPALAAVLDRPEKESR